MTPSVPAVDECTLRRALAGDRPALGVLWRSHNPSLLRFIRTLGVSDPEDVAAQVWLDVVRRTPSVRSPEQFQTVLFTIARRRAIDRHRQRVRRPEVLGDAAVALGADPSPDVDADHLDAVALLGRLPIGVAEVVYLRVALGLAAAQVADITGRSEGAIRVMTMRGLRTLRAMHPDLEQTRVTNSEPSAMAPT